MVDDDELKTKTFIIDGEHPLARYMSLMYEGKEIKTILKMTFTIICDDRIDLDEIAMNFIKDLED